MNLLEGRHQRIQNKHDHIGARLRHWKNQINKQI